MVVEARRCMERSAGPASTNNISRGHPAVLATAVALASYLLCFLVMPTLNTTPVFTLLNTLVLASAVDLVVVPWMNAPGLADVALRCLTDARPVGAPKCLTWQCLEMPDLIVAVDTSLR